MTDNFRQLIAVLMAENIKFELRLSCGKTWFVRDNSVNYENHHWEIDDIEGKPAFWTRENGFDRSIHYGEINDYIEAIKKSLRTLRS